MLTQVTATLKHLYQLRTQQLPPGWWPYVQLLISYIFMITFELMTLCLAPFAILYAQTDFNPTVQLHHHKPILLLHGSSFNQGQWLIMRWLLKRWKMTGVYSLNMDDHTLKATQTIEEYSLKVRDEITRILDNTESDKVVIIGHSLGGIVAGHVAMYNQVHGIISLASPWRGTELIQFIETIIGTDMDHLKQQLKPESQVLKQITQSVLTMEQAGELELLNIGCTHDLLVPNIKSSIISENGFVCQNAGHYSVLFSSFALGQIRKTVKKMVS